MKKLFIVIVSSFMLISCGESSRSSNFTPSESSYSTDGSGYESTDNTNEEDNQPVSQMVTCPMCGGSGVFEFMPDDLMAPRTTCTGCNGSGSVTPDVANEIINSKNQADVMMGTGSNNGSTKSASQLELEIKKAYETLADVTLRPQYDRMIADQKQWIAKLEAQYYGSSY